MFAIYTYTDLLHIFVQNMYYRYRNIICTISSCKCIQHLTKTRNLQKKLKLKSSLNPSINWYSPRTKGHRAKRLIMEHLNLFTFWGTLAGDAYPIGYFVGEKWAFKPMTNIFELKLWGLLSSYYEYLRTSEVFSKEFLLSSFYVNDIFFFKYVFR